MGSKRAGRGSQWVMNDLKAARYAILAARYGSFRQAAAHCGTQQSTVSRLVRNLEDELGTSLFDRNTNGVAPTNAGGEYIREMRHLLERIDTINRSVQAAGRGEEGHIVLGLCGSLSEEPLRKVIDRFQSFNPNVGIELIEANPGDLTHGIRTKSLDAAIVYGIPKPEISDAIAPWRETLCVAVHRDHPWALKKALDWKDLLSTPLTVTERDGLDIATLGQSALGSKLSLQTMGVSSASLLEFVRIGRAVTLIRSGLESQIPGDVSAIPLRSEGGFAQTGAVCCWQRNNDNPVLRRFLSVCRRMGAP